MAKRQAKKRESTGDAKVRLLIRIDAELHERLKSAAEAAEISMNQLVQGILHGAMGNIEQGEPEVGRSGFVRVRPTKKCVFFGRSGIYHSEEDREACREATGRDPVPDDDGAVWFALDFTDRGVVRYQPPA